MNLDTRSKYLIAPVTLNGKAARISGTARRLADVITTERDYKGNRFILKIPWPEAIHIIEEEGGKFYGGKRYVSAEERKRYATGFVIGGLGVLILLVLVDMLFN